MNFRSSGVQPALIRTSVVGNVSKETGIRREGGKKTRNKPHRAPPKGGEGTAKQRGGGGTMGFPQQAFIIWDLKSYQPSPARTNTVAVTQAGSGRVGQHSTVPTLCSDQRPQGKSQGKRPHTLLLFPNKKIKDRRWLWVFSVSPCTGLRCLPLSFNLSNFSIHLRFYPPFIFALDRAKVSGITFIRVS